MAEEKNKTDVARAGVGAGPEISYFAWKRSVGGQEAANARSSIKVPVQRH